YIKNMEEEINRMEEELYSLEESPPDIYRKNFFKIQNLQKQAEKEFNQEVIKLKKKIEEQKKIFQDKIKNKTQKSFLQNKEKLNNVFKNFAQDLISLRDRKIVAKKLDLEKLLQSKLEEEKNKLDEELNQLEENLRKKDQEKKLNLQFKFFGTSSKEEKDAVQKELDAINQDELKQIELKKAQNEKILENIKKMGLIKIEEEIKILEKSLNEDIIPQLKQEEEKYLKEPDLKEKNIYEEKLKLSNKNLILDLEEKKKKIAKKLKLEEKIIIKEILKEQEFSNKTKKESLFKLKLQLKRLYSQREHLIEGLILEIKEKITPIAQEKKIDIVLNEYIININCEDLTSLVIEKLKNSRR
ncbi:MAG: hypothetical protein HYU63_07305, partial [Armatimonadetes bacterium]|nr:hypothetical protein [Armatimonadota bacterium]